MPGEKMLKALNSADQDNNKKLDSKELHDALKDLDKGQIQRGLKNKIEDIKKLNLHEATTDLLTQVESNSNNLSLSEDQLNGLYALHVLLNPGAAPKDGTQLDVKKIDKTLDKSEVMNDVHKANIDAFLKDSGYTFKGWKDGNKTGSAVISKDGEYYILPFKIDGTLDATAPIKDQPVYKETQTVTNDSDNFYKGALDKTNDSVVAYMKKGSLVIEKSADYAKHENNRLFVESLSNVSTDGVFLTQQLDKGLMKVAYLSTDKIVSLLGTGAGFSAYKSQIDGFNATRDNAIIKAKSYTLESDRKVAIDAANKTYTDAISTNMPTYKKYLQDNVDDVMLSLGDSHPDVFEVDANSVLTSPLPTNDLTIDGKDGNTTTETVTNYKSLDEGTVVVSIGKEDNTTSWNVYKKKMVDGKPVYDADKSQKQINPNAPVAAPEKPKEVVSENTDLTDKINALDEEFMFNGGSVDKKSSLKLTQDSLKLLADKGKGDVVDGIVKNLEGSSLTTLTTAQRILSTQDAQASINKLITDNSLKFSINSPYFIDGKLKTDGRWGKITTEALVQVAKALPGTTVDANKGETLPSGNTGTTTPGAVEKNTTAPVSTPNKPSSAPKTAETKKPTIDALATEKKQLIDLQETAKKELNPLLKKLVPDANGMNDYMKHLPTIYAQQLTLLDKTLKMDPKDISDKIAFEKVYPSMSINVKNLKTSLEADRKVKSSDYTNFFNDSAKSKVFFDMLEEKTGFKDVYKGQYREWNTFYSNNIHMGYIKLKERNGKRSWMTAAFLESPTYNNKSRNLVFNKDLCEDLLDGRSIQDSKGYNGPSSNVSAAVFV